MNALALDPKTIPCKALVAVRAISYQKPLLSLEKRYIHMLWLQKGTASYHQNTTEYLVRRNTLICVSAGHNHLEMHENAAGYEIAFDPYLMHLIHNGSSVASDEDLIGLLSGTAGVQVDDCTAPLFEELLAKLSLEEKDDSYRPMLLACYLRIFLVHVLRLYELSVPVYQTHNSLVKRFLILLDKNFRKNKTVASYAEELFVTPGYLNEVVKKQSGYCAREHIKDRIVAEAKRSALASRANMKQIAYDLGFEDIGHFSKFFKNATGTNFTEYRRSGTCFSAS